MREIGSHLTTTSAIVGLGCVAAARGQDERAGTLVGVGDALAERMEMPPDLLDTGVQEGHLAAARTRAAELWDGYRSAGGRMDVEAALDYALG